MTVLVLAVPLQQLYGCSGWSDTTVVIHHRYHEHEESPSLANISLLALVF